MCGIAGFTRRNLVPSAGIARRIASLLAHRGPDQQSVLDAGEITLCAVRLKIIDLEGGNQPMTAGDTAVAFNGEIYNHAELRRELEGLGYRFRSHCDTEVVLHAFRAWDTGCFERLRGMFAVAVAAESGKRLVLARDRVGIKPLYYHRRGPDLIFGSELKAIFEHPGVPRRLNLAALPHYLSLNWVPCPDTLAEGVVKLPPGHLLEWRAGETQLRPWWRLEFHPRRRTLEEAKEELDGLLRESVREHLVADVPLGIWASGGVDSSTILYYAARCAGRPLKTFSVSFAGRNFDESPWFRETARIFGTEHYEFDLNPGRDLESAIAEFAWYSDEPSADAGALPVWYLSRMCREYVTVALSGEGADELFGGYLTYTADRLTRPLRAVPALLRRAALTALERWLPVSDDKIGLEYMLKRGLAGSLLPPDEAHFFWNGAFTPEQRRRLLPWAAGGGPGALAGRLGIPGGAVDYLNRYLWIDQLLYLPDDILYKVDRMSMAHSLEVRPPFLDHRIVEFTASLPRRMKIRGLTQKYLLKELMRGKLPDAILRRRKTGFDIPAHDWFRGPLRGLLLETLRPAGVDATGIFDTRAVEQLIADHLERRINAGYQLWGLVTLFLWMKRWGMEIPAPEEWAAAPTTALAAGSR